MTGIEPLETSIEESINVKEVPEQPEALQLTEEEIASLVKEARLRHNEQC